MEDLYYFCSLFATKWEDKNIKILRSMMLGVSLYVKLCAYAKLFHRINSCNENYWVKGYAYFKGFWYIFSGCHPGKLYKISPISTGSQLLFKFPRGTRWPLSFLVLICIKISHIVHKSVYMSLKKYTVFLITSVKWPHVCIISTAHFLVKFT